MSEINQQHKGGSFAALRNVISLVGLVIKVAERPANLHGLGVFHGRVGFGKTQATIYARNKFRAPMVTIGPTWTKKKLMEAILSELGEPNLRGSTDQLVDRVVQTLGERVETPLLIDEADKAIDRGMIEVIRYIHDVSGAPIILIGEELLPEKLMPFERVHGRVLAWAQAQPCDSDDAQALAACYAPGITIEPALLEHVRTAAKGSARYISANILALREFAINSGRISIVAGDYAGETIITGEYRAPNRRAA
jgi:hypothetical protein